MIFLKHAFNKICYLKKKLWHFQVIQITMSTGYVFLTLKLCATSMLILVIAVLRASSFSLFFQNKQDTEFLN